MKSNDHSGKGSPLLMQGLFMIILSLILIFSGCREEETNHEAIFQGLVMDYDLNIPRPGTMVILSRFDALNLISPAEPYSGLVQDSVVTDEDGKYYFRIDPNAKALYKISFSAVGFLEKKPSPEILARVINYYPINEDTLYIGKSGYVKISVMNSPDGYDSLYLRCNMDRPPPLTWDDLQADHNPHAFRLYSLLADTTILDLYLYKDNDSVYYSWEIIDRSDYFHQNTVFTLLPLDTVFLNIDF
jgi:hypothetical protein